MSRSKSGGKSPGYDFWSKRPGSGMGSGKKVKKITHKKERVQNKKLTKKELKEEE